MKATYYISADAVDALEVARLKLRKLVPVDQRGQINKSAIVEAAIKLAAQSLEEQGPESQIARILVSQKD